jgi:iron complex outermembrane receptor protein
MRRYKYLTVILVWVLIGSSIPEAVSAQSSGTLRGVITVEGQTTALHNVIVSIVQLRRSVETNEVGAYEFTNLPPGNYTVLAHLEGFPDVIKTVQIAGGVVSLDFQLRLAGPREQITVTASGNEQSTFEAFQSVSSLDSTKLVEESHPSLGEVLDKEAGVAKRSFGPGSARPVIRGFDGDRVLVLQDGIRVGSIGSQSGDHGEPVDVLSLERLEVVKGPATLLYGSNAIGGVVNAVTGHDYPHTGVHGYITGIGGTTNDQAGMSGGLEYGIGKWLIWGNASGQRTGDYHTPIGRIENSKTRVGDGLFGLGRYADKSFFSLSYGYDNRRYGVPFAALFEGGGGEEGQEELIDLDMRRHDLRVNAGLRNLGTYVDAFRLTLSYSDYRHRELEGETVGTTFDNNIFSYRGVFEQRRSGRLTGSFGFDGQFRDYETVGAEALAPPVDQKSFSIFTLEEIDFERVKFQLGGRVEHNGYDPAGLRKRSFTGFSGAAGARIALWEGGALVANYTHSYRAPALEELYNFGPHIGNLTFEIGNPDLKRERTDGIDLSLRHSTDRFRAEANLFYYHIMDFVFLAPTGEIEDNLPVANYLQDDSRFIGTELEVDVRLHPKVWLNLGLDYVDAELIDSSGALPSGTPLPRIPPLRGRVGLDFNYRGLSVKPEAVMTRDQDELFPGETRTAGYTVFNVVASYTLPRQHFAHIFSVNAYNLGDRLYRNHLSFIKELAPEMGRGVRLTYTMRFF